ncbi:MAG: phosphoribosylaminoimidazolesuccinocarboxamide synthase, partial [Saprospiraceae bacterium]|nr:phosphoribosylaminoimidazolesuccinocarboxamide synthase [Saprospiraceae bacterium]
MYHGKVRDVYDFGDQLIMIATDRISAFDHILPRPIPYKGQVLNQLAKHFLEATADIVPNWLQATPDPCVSAGIKATPVKLEMVIRAYLCGHAWRLYKSGIRTICGVNMPEGLKENDKFPVPIITPSTKASEG